MSEQEVFGRFLRRRKVLSPLRYPGGKRRLTPYIAATLAANELRPDLFVEPFAGGASVSLELLDADLVGHAVLGDADPMVAAFWRTVFEDADWLCRQVESVPLDLETWERMKGGRWRSQRSLALACLYLNRTSFNGALHRRAGPIGGKAQAGEYDIGCRFPRERLVSRIRACAALGERVVWVSDADGMATVRAAREMARKEEWSTFFYLDPPFWSKAQFLYRRSFYELEHERLADSLHWVLEPFLLSYDPAPEIVELYRGHRGETVAEVELLYTGGNGRSAGRELVISNLPRLPETTRLWRTTVEWSEARASRASGEANACRERASVRSA